MTEEKKKRTRAKRKARTPWTKKTLDDLVEAVAEYGTDDAAAAVVNVSRSRYYEHKRKNPEFKARIEKAKDDFRDANRNEEMGVLSLEAAKKIFREGKTVTTTVKKGKRTTYRRDPKTGKMEVWEVIEEEPTVLSKHFPASDGMVKLYAPLDLKSAQQMLEKHGFRVIDPTLVEEVEKGGLTEDTYRQITGRILGVNTEKDDINIIDVEVRESDPGDEDADTEGDPKVQGQGEDF